MSWRFVFAACMSMQKASMMLFCCRRWCRSIRFVNRTALERFFMNRSVAISRDILGLISDCLQDKDPLNHGGSRNGWLQTQTNTLEVGGV